MRLRPSHAILHGHFIIPEEVAQVHLQPVEPMWSEGFRLVKHHNASAKVITEMTQIRRDRVSATAEVDVVREIHHIILELVRNVHLDRHVAAQRVELAILLVYARAHVLVTTLIKTHFFGICIF